MGNDPSRGGNELTRSELDEDERREDESAAFHRVKCTPFGSEHRGVTTKIFPIYFIDITFDYEMEGRIHVRWGNSDGRMNFDLRNNLIQIEDQESD